MSYSGKYGMIFFAINFIYRADKFLWDQANVCALRKISAMCFCVINVQACSSQPMDAHKKYVQFGGCIVCMADCC